jgi:uncharacterized protein (DUF362 family)
MNKSSSPLAWPCPSGTSATQPCSRRQFLHTAGLLAASAPLFRWQALQAAPSAARYNTRVAIAPCASYGEEVRTALRNCFDLLGGIGPLVKAKTVTVKINLTGTDFQPFHNRPVGETYMTHFATAYALAQLLLEAGARRIRFAESTNSRSDLQTSLGYAGWDLKPIEALGKVQFENTRNLGSGSSYGNLRVPFGGYLFSQFEFNRAYADTDVLVSLCKLKQHLTCGVTLSLKNLFGITPNSLYSEELGSEDATKGRGTLHNPSPYKGLKLPGAKEGPTSNDPTYRVPRIVVDICAARPVDLAIIDGITSISGGEGTWCSDVEKVTVVQPGVLIAGLNPVSTDAIGTAVMGYANPRAPRGQGAFKFCENTLLLAEQAGLGTADLAQIDLRGLPLEKARHPYPELDTAKRAERLLKQQQQRDEQ